MPEENPSKLDHAPRSGPGGAHVRWSMFGARGPLLNSESSGAGGGQSPAPGSPSPTTTLFATPAAAPAVPPASTPPSPPAADPGAATPQANGTDLATLLTAVTAMQQEVATLRNAVYANQRRGGQPPPKKQESTPDPSGTPPATSTMDLARMRELDRAITRSGATPDGAAYKRIERDFAAENPEDAESWLKGYFEGLGVKPAQQPQTAAPAAPVTQPNASAPPARPLVTNLGSPPAPQVPLEQQDLATMSLADKAEIIRTKGASWFKQTLLTQQKGRQIKFG